MLTRQKAAILLKRLTVLTLVCFLSVLTACGSAKELPSELGEYKQGTHVFFLFTTPG